MNYIYTVAIALTILTVIFFTFLRVLFYMTFHPQRKHTANPRRIPNDDQYGPIKSLMLSHIDELEALEYEEVSVTSFDGLRLFGRYYKRSRENIIELDFHGYRGNAMRDYCGGSVISRKCGISSIIVDQRCHGKSEGSAITFGINERLDVKKWVEYTVKRFGRDTKIILSGVSMGAATVLMASELDLPNVVCILADCPYSSPKEIICKVARDRKYPDKLLYPFVRLCAKIFARVDIESSSAREAVKHTNIPILIIHGDDDRYVPYEMGKAVFEVCTSEQKQMLTVKNAGHAISYFLATEEYTKTVTEFVEKAIEKSETV